MDLTKKITTKRIGDFVEFILGIQAGLDFKVSSRGWGYIMEQKGIITKDQFDKIEDVINRARKRGLLPVDFVAEEAARSFEQIHTPSTETYGQHIAGWLAAVRDCDSHFEPDWWNDEEYYIQTVVEKIDLVSLFTDISGHYHIPIANSKGWSSISQRAEYCKRFAQAEARGLKCVLLYCGDHDPDGLRISDTLRQNLLDIKDVVWSDGTPGYDPSDLIIDRFGLSYAFIQRHRLTWIDNLITGSGKDLGSPKHPNYNQAYMKAYRKKIGRRKCEANAIVTAHEMGRALYEATIQKYLGKDALKRFDRKKRKVMDEIQEVMDEQGVNEAIELLEEKLDNYNR